MHCPSGKRWRRKEKERSKTTYNSFSLPLRAVYTAAAAAAASSISSRERPLLCSASRFQAPSCDQARFIFLSPSLSLTLSLFTSRGETRCGLFLERRERERERDETSRKTCPSLHENRYSQLQEFWPQHYRSQRYTREAVILLAVVSTHAQRDKKKELETASYYAMLFSVLIKSGFRRRVIFLFHMPEYRTYIRAVSALYLRVFETDILCISLMFCLWDVHRDTRWRVNELRNYSFMIGLLQAINVLLYFHSRHYVPSNYIHLRRESYAFSTMKNVMLFSPLKFEWF